MNWFYAKDGQQAGPVDDAELDRLVTTGDIADSTLVWHSGLPNWQPYAAVRAGAGAGGVATLPGGTGAVRVESGQAQCSQCGRVFPADEVVRIDNLDVCAECKPGFIQRLREGAIVGGSPRYAGFGIRLGAAILDGLILIPFYIVYGVLVYFFTGLHNVNFSSPQSIQQFTTPGVSILLGLGASFVLAFYSAFFVHRFGGTPGKRICGLRVLRGNVGEPVSFGRALGRYAAKALPRSVPLIGFIYTLVDPLFIVFDDQKRALHDMLCDTRVIYDSK